MHKLKPILYKVLVLAICFGIVLSYTFIDKKHISIHHFEIVKKYDTATLSIYGVSHKNILVPTNQRFYINDYLVIGDTANLNQIKSNVIKSWSNNKLYKVNIATLTNVPDSLKNRKDIYSFHKNIVTQKSVFPFIKNFINWNGDFSFFLRIVAHPLLVFLMIILLLQKKIIKIFEQKKFIPAASYTTLWNVTLLFSITIVFAFILYKDQYYFNQDDNYAQFTPVLLQGLNDWYSFGNIPTYNPYQLVGVPTTELSTYAFFYPVTHIAYLISKYICNDVLWFSNVFMYIHFIIGALFFFKIMQYYKIYIGYAFAATIGFIFCGFNLETTRSWCYVAPTIAFMPLLYCLCLKATKLKHIHWKQQIIAGFLIAIYAYSGNVQFFTYSCILTIIIWFSITTFPFFKKVQYIAIPFIIAVLLFLPQLIISANAFKNIHREVAGGDGILSGFGSLFLPFVLNETKPLNWGTEELLRNSKYFYHGSAIFLIAAFTFLFSYFLKYKKNSFFRNSNAHLKILILVLTIVTLLSFGRNGVLWLATSKLPILNNFSLPFKFLFYIQFVGTLAGVLVLQQMQFAFKNCIAALSIAITLFAVHNTIDAFYVYANGHNNYENNIVVQKVTEPNYRVMSFATLRSYHPDYNKTLTNNLPTQYNINSIQGYEPLYYNKVEPELNVNEWSVKYFVVSTLNSKKDFYTNYYKDAMLYCNKPGVQLIYSDSTTKIYENKNAIPIVAVYNNDTLLQQVNPIITNHNNGVNIQFKKAIQLHKIILAYNFIPGLCVFVNNKKITATSDALGRIVLYPKESVLQICTIYRPYPF